MVLRYCLVIFVVCNVFIINYRYYSKFEFRFFSTESVNLKHPQKPFPSVMDFNSWNIVWSLCFGSLATLIIVGNLVTIWIFLKQRLRKRAHFLLISLSVADLLVGLLTVPLYITINIISYLNLPYLHVWPLSEFADIFTGVASIVTLSAISLERVYAIGWPFRHRTLNFRIYMFAIAIPWILATTFTSISLLRFIAIITLKAFMYCLIMFLSTPLSVMCMAYFVVWRKQKTMMGNRNHVVRETRLAKTLFIITAASLVTWLPFQILNLLAIRGELGGFPYLSITVDIVKFLQFSNSLVNVIIYPFRITEFKNGLVQILRCWATPRNRRNEVVSMHQGILRQLHHRQELHIPNH